MPSPEMHHDVAPQASVVSADPSAAPASNVPSKASHSQYLVLLDAPLRPDEVTRVAAEAAPALGVPVARLRAFLTRKGSEPLSRSNNPSVAYAFAAALRDAGAPVRVHERTLPAAPEVVDPKTTTTWSDVIHERERAHAAVGGSVVLRADRAAGRFGWIDAFLVVSLLAFVSGAMANAALYLNLL